MADPRHIVEMGGIGVTPLSAAGLVERMVNIAAGPAQGRVFYLNAHVFNLLSGDAALRSAYASADLVWPDGVSGRLACRLAGARAPERLGGYWYLDRLAPALTDAGRRVFLLGAKADIVAAAADELARRYGPRLVAGHGDGYFTDADESAVIEAINASGADALAVGMGSPRQELWLTRNAGRLSPRLLWTVGALFDFIAGAEPPAPAWVRAINCEWLWRLALDPVGKFRRYVIGNPLYVWRLLRNRPRLRR